MKVLSFRKLTPQDIDQFLAVASSGTGNGERGHPLRFRRYEVKTGFLSLLAAGASAMLLLVLSACSVMAQADVAPRDTPELKALQSQYRVDAQEALRPVRERYIAQYEALIRSFMAKRNLPAAVAAQAEIDSIKKSASEEFGGGTRITHRELEKEVIGHWTYASPKVWLGVRPDGKAYLEKAVLTWTVNSEKSVVLTDPGKPGLHAILEFDSRVDSFTGTDFDGKRINGVRRDRD